MSNDQCHIVFMYQRLPGVSVSRDLVLRTREPAARLAPSEALLLAETLIRSATRRSVILAAAAAERERVYRKREVKR
jgi:hypothetical protein